MEGMAEAFHVFICPHNAPLQTIPKRGKHYFLFPAKKGDARLCVSAKRLAACEDSAYADVTITVIMTPM
jgi:hypothetical protein